MDRKRSDEKPGKFLLFMATRTTVGADLSATGG